MKQCALSLATPSKFAVNFKTALLAYQIDFIQCPDLYALLYELRFSDCRIILMGAVGISADACTAAIVRLRQSTYAPILVLTGEAQPAPELLQAGADLCLPLAVEERTASAHALALLRRYSLYNHYDTALPNAAVLYRGELMIDPQRHSVALGGKPINLQRQEFRLLVRFARNPGIVLTPDQICEAIWQNEYSYNRDVTPIISALRRKLKDNKNAPTYIETVHGIGYRFLPQY